MPKTSHQDGQINWFKEKLSTPRGKPEGWFSVDDLAKITGDNRKTISNRISSMLRNGEIENMKCLIDGHICNVYRKKKL